MSQLPPAVTSATAAAATSGAPASVSGSPSENNANVAGAGYHPPAPASRLRSCVTCRTRKVRCDKASPCANCRRAGIDCVFPSPDNRPPRWARRLERVANSARAAAAVAEAAAAATTTTTTTEAAPQNAAVATADVDPGVAQVMDRLRSLEGLVKELSSQLEQARTSTPVAGAGSGGTGSPLPSSVDAAGSANRAADSNSPHHVDALPVANTSNVQMQFGRLVLGDASRSRYVSSGFWSRVNDELEGLKMDAEGLAGGEYDSSGDEENSPGKTPSTQELDRTPSERHAFLFRHNLSSPAPDLRVFHPLPSQIPFLLDVYSENINLMAQMVHMPTIKKMMRDLRSNDHQSALTPANEALMFAIYYAAITSVEEDDVSANFGASKSELNLKYRLGFEHALAKADFLNVPDIVLVQAFGTFLSLVRRHDSPRFVWMMTGLLIRMAQALGLHRDGSHFAHLTPFEVEMRRRVWWGVCMLDVRASEDQGTDFTIGPGSFDTRLPLNIDDADIGPDTKEMPAEREGLTDMTIALVSSGMCDVTQQMMAVSARSVDATPASIIRDQTRLLDEFHGRLESRYLRYVDNSGGNNIAHWVMVTVARLMVAKMTLITHLPVLFSSTPSPSPSPAPPPPPPSEQHQHHQHQQEQEHFDGDQMRAKLCVAALEVAEYNHALNAERSCRHWRWVFQTYTHWYAIVYLLLAAARRPWSPASERAWVALHSVWLIPAQSQPHSSSTSADRNDHPPPQQQQQQQQQRIWVPLRKLWAKARRHRESELARLRGDPGAAARLEAEDRRGLQPASPAPFPGVGDGEGAAAAAAAAAEFFRERWRRLVMLTSWEEEGVGGAGKVKGMPTTAAAAAAAAQTMGHDARLTTGNISTSMSDFGLAPPYHSSGPSTSQRPDLASAAYYRHHHPYHHQQQANSSSSGGGGGGVPMMAATNSNPHSLVPPGPSYSSVSVGAFPLPSNTADWSSSDARSLGPGFGAWLFADADAVDDAEPEPEPEPPLLSVDAFANMDVEATAAAVDLNSGMDVDGGGGGSSNGSEQVDWNSWVESAKGMGWLGEPSVGGGNWGSN